MLIALSTTSLQALLPFLVLEITFIVISIAFFTLYLALLSSLLPANANAVQPQILEQPLSGLSERGARKNLNPVTPQDIMSSSPRVGARRRSRLVLGTTPPTARLSLYSPPPLCTLSCCCLQGHSMNTCWLAAYNKQERTKRTKQPRQL